MVFLRCKSFSERSAIFPSNANSSLKCTMKYLPCLCNMWHDWYSVLSFLEATPIRVKVSLTLRKSSGSVKITSNGLYPGKFIEMMSVLFLTASC